MVRDSRVVSPFGGLLRRHRLAAGLTQELLAERSGVAKRTLQDLELGATRPRRETVRRLIGALRPSAEVRAQFEAATSAPRQRTGQAAGGNGHEASPDDLGVVGDSAVRGLASAPRQNLIPTALTSFIGRERELAELQGLLETRRLLTLTGPGGSGKTRLALELTARVQRAYSGGVYVVSLAPLADPGLVAATIAEAFGMHETTGGSLLDRLARVIGEKTVLLLLDNFEHLVCAGPLLIELLSACPQLTVLVTSREVLRLRGEQTCPVPPLSLPDAISSPSTEDALVLSVSESAAVRLFVDRAQHALPTFRLDASNAIAVADICRHLDGLPLAIELAAAQVRHLTPGALRLRLEHRLPTLTGGAQDMPARQRTLRDAIARSYDLLSESEQWLLRRLGVFVGGFTLEAAAAVYDGAAWGERPGTRREPDDSLLEMVGSLVTKSLVVPVRMTGDEPRFGMLETIREFSLEQLNACGEAEATRERYAAFFLALAESASTKLLGSEQIPWLRRLAVEHDNVRTVLAQTRDGQIPGLVGLRLAAALACYWSFRGNIGEGRGWVEAMLALPAAAPRTAVRARALYAAAWLANWQSGYAAAQSYTRESVAIFRAVDDLHGVGRSLGEQGVAEMHGGDPVAAWSTLNESASVAREIGDLWGLAVALGQLGRLESDVESARALVEASASLARDIGDRFTLGLALASLAQAARRRGDHDESAVRFKEALVVSSELEDPWITPRALAGLASAACLQSDYERAARLFGTAEAFREVRDAREHPRWRAIVEPDVANLRVAFGDSAFRAAWAEGRAMTLEQAIAYALEGHGHT